MYSLSTIDLEKCKNINRLKIQKFFFSKQKKRGSNNAMEKIKEY